MSKRTSVWTVGFLGCALLASVSTGWGAAPTRTYAGQILAVDRATGTIVVGDMGPRLDDGQSKITHRNIRVTPATEFASVRRSDGAAPSGWIGDFVEQRLPAWDVKPGDFVAVTVASGAGPAAVKVMVVDTND
jgi:hypothetical protein